MHVGLKQDYIYIDEGYCTKYAIEYGSSIMPLKREFFGDKATKKKGAWYWFWGPQKDRKKTKSVKHGGLF